MLVFNKKGIYCSQADIYIDPWQPVAKAIITHAHADHARSGCLHYLCHRDTAPLLKMRLGEAISVTSLSFNEPVYINGVKISLHPAGHIIGSAQVRLEYKGEVWGVSGDYKLQDDGLSGAFEPLRCHSFVTESTFGLPVYKFPAQEEVYGDMNKWCADNVSQGMNSVLIGYALGKAQRILQHISGDRGPVYCHGAVDNVNKVLTGQGIRLRESTRVLSDMTRKDIQRAVIIAPPSAMGSSWLNRFSPYRIALCSGWMQLRGARRRRSVDRGFVLSDHCDWLQLDEAITATGAEKVYVTHGYQHTMARWLREERGIAAEAVETLYGAASEDVGDDILSNDQNSSHE